MWSTRQVPDAADIDWSYWRTKVEPELVDMFQDALKRASPGLSRLHRPELTSGTTISLPAGLKLPRFVPTYEAVDALFEPILEDARELQEYAAKRVIELEAELARVNYELVRMRPLLPHARHPRSLTHHECPSQEKLGSCEDPLRPRLTMEEEMELNPEIFAKIDQEIMDGEWTTTNGDEAPVV